MNPLPYKEEIVVHILDYKCIENIKLWTCPTLTSAYLLPPKAK